MTDPSDSTEPAKIRLVQLLPNLLTITAICAGLTAIRSGYEGKFEIAVGLVLFAAVLDGLDGRLARLTKSSSAVGAELDSLADFLNFGVAPVLILHTWALEDLQYLHRAGWIAVLFYTVCCVLRLARFNVGSRMEPDAASSDYFVGVPSPAGAMLVMLPMVLAFATTDMTPPPPALIAIHISLIGWLMISRVQTFSFKNMSIDRANSKYAMLAAAILVAALLTYFWATLAVLTFAYVATIAWAWIASRFSA